MVLLSILMICLTVVYVGMEIACSKLRSRMSVPAVRTADKIGCFKAFVSSVFMVCGGFFARNMKKAAASMPGADGLSKQSNNAFVEFAPYIFFVLGGLLFVFAIVAVAQYLKDYEV